MILDKLKTLLRNDYRIKDGVDYAITFKYRKYHLMSAGCFLARIRDEAQRLGIHFSTLSTYEP